MTKKTLKMLSLLGAASVVGGAYASADCGPCPNAMFTAKGCETQRISIGGLVTTNYQWIDVRDHTRAEPIIVDDVVLFNFGDDQDPETFSNFYMKNIRLFVRADLCDSWSAFMGVDFAGINGDSSDTGNRRNFLTSSFTCRDRKPVFIDRAYIEKKWCASTLRVGYQKVNFGAEEAIPDEYLKTIEHSIATNFFMHLGRRAVAGAYAPGVPSVEFGGGNFADRHVGVYLSGDACSFHYNLAVVNGEQGLCRNSDRFDNELGYFAGIAYENCACGVDVLLGFNAGYKPKGGSHFTRVCGRNPHDSVWGINPYILANWNCLSILAEMLYGSVEHSKLTDRGKRANPYGFNFVPSYMINDCWEIVGRISYLNTNRMGTTIHNAFGSAPDQGNTQLHPFGGCRDNTFISSERLFNKATAGYIGVNYYTVNQSVKATLGYECAKFKDQFDGFIAETPDVVAVGHFGTNHVFVNAVRAQLQLLF